MEHKPKKKYSSVVLARRAQRAARFRSIARKNSYQATEKAKEERKKQRKQK